MTHTGKKDMISFSSENLSTRSLKNHPLKDSIADILSSALEAVDPYQALLDHLSITDDNLTVNGKSITLGDIERIYAIGAGKAGAPMVTALHYLFGDSINAGIVIVKDGHLDEQARFVKSVRLYEASHPLPDERGVKATQAILQLLTRTTDRDLVFVLISGGGSALMTAPPPGITLQDMRKLTDLLLASGAEITEINAVRKHLDLVKGGQLAQAAYPARVICLILSDVVGDSLDMIASGPTVPDTTTYQDAINILRKYCLETEVPESVITHLTYGMQGLVRENPDERNPIFQKVTNIIIGSNSIACQAAENAARARNMDTEIITTSLQGIASERGIWFASEVRKRALTGRPFHRPLCLIAGGETTVILQGDGLGGRNQEFALAAAPILDGVERVVLITLATDGGDGPTEAAGAVVTGNTCQIARKAGLLPEEYLMRNDSYHFFKQLGDLVITGPTQTNVNDLVLALVF